MIQVKRQKAKDKIRISVILPFAFLLLPFALLGFSLVGDGFLSRANRFLIA